MPRVFTNHAKVEVDTSRFAKELGRLTPTQSWLRARLTGEKDPDDTDEVMWAQEEAIKCLESAMSLGDPQLPLDLRAAVPDHTMRSKVLNEGRLEELINNYGDFYDADAESALYAEWADRLDVPFEALASLLNGQITGTRVPSFVEDHWTILKDTSKVDEAMRTVSIWNTQKSGYIDQTVISGNYQTALKDLISSAREQGINLVDPVVTGWLESLGSEGGDMIEDPDQPPDFPEEDDHVLAHRYSSGRESGDELSDASSFASA